MLAVLLPLLLAPAADIIWENEYGAAVQKARTQKKVLLIALNMDKEKANDLMASKTYKDSRIAEFSRYAVNLIGSREIHAFDGICPRFGSLSCKEHQEVEKNVPRDLLTKDPAGLVIAPQHLLLDTDGKIIMKVAYLISRDELAWFLSTGLKLADASWKGEVPSYGKRPMRLEVGEGYQVPDERAPGVKLSKEEVLELIKKANKAGVKGATRKQRREYIGQIITSDKPAALKFIQAEMNSKWMTQGKAKIKRDLLRALGNTAPAAYWKMVAGETKDIKPLVRNEAAVALEQLAVPEAAKAIKMALGKEKDATVRRNLIRALGACAKGNKKAIAAIMKEAKKSKEPAARVNAIIALSGSSANADVKTFLEDTIKGISAQERAAAGLAMALSGNADFGPAFNAALQKESDTKIKTAFQAIMATVQSGKGKGWTKLLQKIAGDKIPRARLAQPR